MLILWSHDLSLPASSLTTILNAENTLGTRLHPLGKEQWVLTVYIKKIGHFRVAFYLCSKTLQVQKLSHENSFDLHLNELVCKTDFHMKGFAFGLVLPTSLKYGEHLGCFGLQREKDFRVMGLRYGMISNWNYCFRLNGEHPRFHLKKFLAFLLNNQEGNRQDKLSTYKSKCCSSVTFRGQSQ